jgi:predicted transcriptional regulator
MSKKLIEIASEIVQAQVSLSSMSGSEIASSLREVFRTLQDLQKSEMGELDINISESNPETTQEEAPKQITPALSLLEDKVICLECGAEMRQLTQKHLIKHGMNQKDYKLKYGFSMRTSLAAKSLTKARSKAARKRGLPENLKKFQEERRLEKAALPSAPIASENSTIRRSGVRKKRKA